MRSIIAFVVIAIVLAVAGEISWAAGHTETRLVEAHKQLALLEYDVAQKESDDAASVPAFARIGGPVNFARGAAADARQVGATARYWEGDHHSLAPQRDAAGALTETDPDVLMLGANASFRASQLETDRNAALRKLDAVVKNYAEVVKATPGNVDAAYNYEYAVRLRDMLQKRPPSAKLAAPKAAAVETDLPQGPTLHGRPGGPPPKTDMSQFKIVIPKRGEERKDDPQAGKGGTKVRKG